MNDVWEGNNAARAKKKKRKRGATKVTLEKLRTKTMIFNTDFYFFLVSSGNSEAAIVITGTSQAFRST